MIHRRIIKKNVKRTILLGVQIMDFTESFKLKWNVICIFKVKHYSFNLEYQSFNFTRNNIRFFKFGHCKFQDKSMNLL